jgi:hypothetical protein
MQSTITESSELRPPGFVHVPDDVNVWVSRIVIPSDAAALVHVVPFDVSTLPDVLGATNATADVPLPKITLFAVSVVAPVPPLATATVPVTFAAVPVVFWFSVGNVQLAKLPDAGVPNAGVTNVGLVANTKDPEPVSSVTAAARFALDGVPKNVATPAPKEVKPVPPLATGRVPDTWVAKPIFP